VYVVCSWSIDSLNLMWNGIHHEGAAALAKSLVPCTRLVSMSLAYNHIFVEGARALATVALPHLQQVRGTVCACCAFCVTSALVPVGEHSCPGYRCVDFLAAAQVGAGTQLRG